MSQNVIKIKTRKDDYKRIYRDGDLSHYTPRTQRNYQQLDWLCSLFSFGTTSSKYYVEFTPADCSNDFDWRITLVNDIRHVLLKDCPCYIQNRYKRQGYTLDAQMYCFEFEG